MRLLKKKNFCKVKGKSLSAQFLLLLLLLLRLPFFSIVSKIKKVRAQWLIGFRLYQSRSISLSFGIDWYGVSMKYAIHRD